MKMRPLTMVCTDCKAQNYVTTKNKTNVPDRMEFSKYCPKCRKHQLHREKR